jgi:hypothetical protein
MTHCLQNNFYQLSGDLLVKVMSFVERQQRIGTCSLVCHAWRSAAAAATSDISINLRLQDASTQPDGRCCALETWVMHHGEQVRSLQLTCTDIAGWPLGLCSPIGTGPTPTLQVHVPCQHLVQLQRLTIVRAQLQPLTTAGDTTAAGDFSSSSVAARASRSSTKHISTSRSIRAQLRSGPAFLSGLNSLTMLQLTECSLAGWAHGLAGVSALTQLQHLHLRELTCDDNISRESDAKKISAQLRAALPHMTALTYLCVRKYHLTAALLQGLGHLQQLRELRFKHIQNSRQTSRALNLAIAKLPVSITSLRISVQWWSRGAAPVFLDSSGIRALQQLSKLQRLGLPGVQLQDVTGFMGAASQMTSLSLRLDG